MASSLKRIVVLGVGIVASALATSGAEGQVAVADARAFLGDWNVAVEGEMPATVRLNITDNQGQVAIAVTNSEGNAATVSTIKKDGENLVVTYNTTLQGSELPIAITLAPDGAGLKGNLDIAGGMYTAPLKAAKRE